ncbi:DUF1028 domain-containing protein [Kouleothrix sp.]|uniref:DUF1028 domain-containing protein n=1 Tax=Kouleothrix sp. TaxID=2779161 RepID=UPI00391C0E43
MKTPIVATFSIAAHDPRNGDLGVAVASKFLSVGSVVPWAQAGAGAVATQAMANISYGPRGLALLAAGQPADAALAALLADDADREHRQAGLVDARGHAAAHTGAACMDWAGHVVGAGFAAQGNILAGPHVVDAIVAAFGAAEGELADRLLAALAAGDAAGGDRRGRQSAALYVARAGGSYGGLLDRYIDLRVDDHPAPVGELGRLLRLHRFYLTPPRPEELLPIDAALAGEIQALLARAGYYTGPVGGGYDDATHAALERYGGVENLEERLISRSAIDPQVLAYMREKIG